MRRRRMGMTVLAALALAACRDEGGELRDATARRRAELANADTSDAEDTGAVADTSSRLPVFVADSATAAKPDSAKTDSAGAAGLVSTEWTTGVREAKHPGGSATLRGLRAAANAGFDRLVLDFGDDAIPSWRVEYAREPVTQCGSGETEDLPGAVLRVRLQYTQAHDDAGNPTIRQRSLTLSMPVMRRLVVTCDFEGQVELAIAAAGAQPFRVTELRSPSRLAIDLQQQP